MEKLSKREKIVRRRKSKKEFEKRFKDRYRRKITQEEKRIFKVGFNSGWKNKK